jgi:hypothetical protein
VYRLVVGDLLLIRPIIRIGARPFPTLDFCESGQGLAIRFLQSLQIDADFGRGDFVAWSRSWLAAYSRTVSPP